MSPEQMLDHRKLIDLTLLALNKDFTPTSLCMQASLYALIITLLQGFYKDHMPQKTAFTVSREQSFYASLTLCCVLVGKPLAT